MNFSQIGMRRPKKNLCSMAYFADKRDGTDSNPDAKENGFMCPFLEHPNSACAGKITLRNLTHVMTRCSDCYKQCRYYRQAFTEAHHANASQSRSIRFAV